MKIENQNETYLEIFPDSAISDFFKTIIFVIKKVEDQPNVKAFFQKNFKKQIFIDFSGDLLTSNGSGRFIDKLSQNKPFFLV